MKKRILIVEDSAIIRTYLCETLRARGLDVVGTQDLAKAWNIISQERNDIHLVITDYYLPDGTGYDLLEKIRTHSNTCSIPVIFLTRESDETKILRARQLGVSSWIVKPYRAAAFFEEICKFIDC